LAASGDRPAALRQYRRCVAILRRELGVAPLPETTAHYEAIRDTTPVPRPSVVTPFVGARDVPPLVGREESLAAIAAARRAATTGGRVVVLVGEAGIGKTRLAEAATAEARTAGCAVIA